MRTTPNASPARDLLAWSPPPARALIAPAPRDLPPTSRRFVTLRLLPSSGPPPVRELPPGGSPLVCPYNPARLTSGPARFPKTGSPHPTRFQSSVRGPRRAWRPSAPVLPRRGFSPPFRTRAMRGQGFPLPLPPVPPPPRRPGALRPSRSCGRTTDTRRLAAGLSAAPAGHRQVGSDFPTHRRRGRLRPLGLRPLPTFGADSRAISGPTCPGRPSSYRSPIPRGLIAIDRRPLSLQAPR